MAAPITLPVLFDDGTTKDVRLTAAPKEKDKHAFNLMILDEDASTLTFSADYNEWQHDGHLSPDEQIQIAGFIQNYMDTEWDN